MAAQRAAGGPALTSWTQQRCCSWALSSVCRVKRRCLSVEFV